MWRHNWTSYSRFQINVLAKSVDAMHILPHALSVFHVSLNLIKLSALQVRISEENTLNATTQQFKTAKISGCTLKQGSKTHSSPHQSDLLLPNQAALMSRRIRALEHRRCAAGLACTLQFARSNLANYTKILLRMRIQYARKLSFFL